MGSEYQAPQIRIPLKPYNFESGIGDWYSDGCHPNTSPDFEGFGMFLFTWFGHILNLEHSATGWWLWAGIRMKRWILPKDVSVDFMHNALSSTDFAMGFNFESYLLWCLLRIWPTSNIDNSRVEVDQIRRSCWSRLIRR